MTVVLSAEETMLLDIVNDAVASKKIDNVMELKNATSTLITSSGVSVSKGFVLSVSKIAMSMGDFDMKKMASLLESLSPLATAPTREIVKTSSADAPEIIETPPQPPAPPKKLVPAVPIEESYGPDFVICLEDGKKMVMLKRYLNRRYGMTQEEYRRKWGLPDDHPLVATNYSKMRAEAARERFSGKGKKQLAAAAAGGKSMAEAFVDDAPPPVATEAAAEVKPEAAPKAAKKAKAVKAAEEPKAEAETPVEEPKAEQEPVASE